MEVYDRIRAVQLPHDDEGDLTDSQIWALTIVNFVSCYLSVSASCWVLGLLAREQEWFTYERILVYSRICIIVQGIGLCLAPFLPTLERGRGLAFGNEKTCDAGGFLMQVGFSVPLYSASLSVLYLLSISYHVDTMKVAQKYEWVLHLVPLVFAYGSAMLGLVGNVYEEADFGLGCWVSGRIHPVWVWIFLGFPFIITLKTVITCTLSVALASKRYSRENGPRQPARLYPVDITKPHPKKMQDDAVQCQMYAASCLFCIIWMMIVRFLDEGPTGDRNYEADYYWLILMAHLTYPLQGFIDFFIFLRPAVIQKLRYDRSLTKAMAFRAVLFGAPQERQSKNVETQQSFESRQHSNPESVRNDIDPFDDDSRSQGGFSVVSLTSRSAHRNSRLSKSQSPTPMDTTVQVMPVRLKRALSGDSVLGEGDVVHSSDWLE